MPVELKVAILGKSDGEVELRVEKHDLNTRVSGRVVGWNSEHGQLAVTEGELLDGLCIEHNLSSDLDELVSSGELECGGLVAILEGSDSDGSQPGVVVIGSIRNKQSIHL